MRCSLRSSVTRSWWCLTLFSVVQRTDNILKIVSLVANIFSEMSNAFVGSPSADIKYCVRAEVQSYLAIKDCVNDEYKH